MTAQSMATVTSAHPMFEVGKFRVVTVIRGEPEAPRYGGVYTAAPGRPGPQFTTNWKGYKEVWHVTGDGHLVLVRFDYDLHAQPSQAVNETIEGDFYLVLRGPGRTTAGTAMPCQYVRFNAGRLCLDRRTWKRERGPLPTMGHMSGVVDDFPPRSMPSDESDESDVEPRSEARGRQRRLKR